ncbi:hypothetical protein FDECE_6988 [Fusarium decemcellulare]|nr:hypothetical protein FDECE_6988 [Fusarium decemcellulare]
MDGQSSSPSQVQLTAREAIEHGSPGDTIPCDATRYSGPQAQAGDLGGRKTALGGPYALQAALNWQFHDAVTQQNVNVKRHIVTSEDLADAALRGGAADKIQTMPLGDLHKPRTKEHCHHDSNLRRAMSLGEPRCLLSEQGP